MRLHASKSWHRKAVVTASIVLLAAVATGAFFMLRQGGTAEIRLLEAGAAPAGVSGSLTAESGAGGLKRDDRALLQEALYDLLECKRLLDQVR